MPAADKYDLVVIGSGPAGEKAAAEAASFGKCVAMVERAPTVGGACVHTGTLPSKTLRETALYLTGFEKRQLYGLTLDFDREASLRRLLGRLHDVIERQIDHINRNIDRRHVTLLHGSAAFVSDRELVLHDENGRETSRLTADFFLIATGSSPFRPAGVPFDDFDVEDSDTILDLDRIPETLAIVGGGVIGCEYASIFTALGTRVTIVEGRPRLMGFLDREISKAFRAVLERQGHQVRVDAEVQSIRRQPGGSLWLTFSDGEEIPVDKVLYSAGRVGNTKGLGLDRASVAVDGRGHISVNEHFQTSVPHIYAAGDVIGRPALASVSMEQGRVAVCHAFGMSLRTSVSELMPFGVYTIPEISMIGATEDDLRERRIAFEIGRAHYQENMRGLIDGEQEGVLKLMFDPATRKLLGVHIMGEHATELIHVGQAVMANQGTIDYFIDAVFNFPTLAELYKYAAYDGLGKLARHGHG